MSISVWVSLLGRDTMSISVWESLLGRWVTSSPYTLLTMPPKSPARMTSHGQEQIMAIDRCPEMDVCVCVCVRLRVHVYQGRGARGSVHKLLILTGREAGFQNEGQLSSVSPIRVFSSLNTHTHTHTHTPPNTPNHPVYKECPYKEG